MGLGVADKKISGGRNKCTEVRSDKLDILEDTIVLPQTVQHERGLIFLNGELWQTLSIYPGMPTAAPGTIRVVFVQQVAARRQYGITEIVEPSCDFTVSRVTQRIGDQRSIAGPHIGVAIAGIVLDISIICRDDSSAVVYLRA